MQLNLLEKKHLIYLEKEFGISEKRFKEICRDNDEDLDKLIDELLWRECDAAEEFHKTNKYTEDGLCAIQLIDIICGPYDEKAINEYISAGNDD